MGLACFQDRMLSYAARRAKGGGGGGDVILSERPTGFRLEPAPLKNRVGMTENYAHPATSIIEDAIASLGRLPPQITSWNAG